MLLIYAFTTINDFILPPWALTNIYPKTILISTVNVHSGKFCPAQERRIKGSAVKWYLIQNPGYKNRSIKLLPPDALGKEG